MLETIVIRVRGNSPNCGDFSFPQGATLGQVFDRVGASPREGFRPSHTLVIRRRHNVKPHSIELPMSDPGWREFPVIEMDAVIYQYDVDDAESTG